MSVPPAPPGYGAPPPGYGGPPPGSWQTTSFGGARYAGFGSRLGGTLLDGLFFLLLYLPFLIPGIVLMVRAFDDCETQERFDGTTELVCADGALDGASLGGGIALLAVGYVLILLFFLRMLATSGQTWGRKIANVKVVRADDGQPPGWGRAIGRSLFAWLISGQVCYLGYLWMLWDKDNRTWHDMVAGTRVIKV